MERELEIDFHYIANNSINHVYEIKIPVTLDIKAQLNLVGEYINVPPDPIRKDIKALQLGPPSLLLSIFSFFICCFLICIFIIKLQSKSSAFLSSECCSKELLNLRGVRGNPVFAAFFRNVGNLGSPRLKAGV